MKHFHAVIFDMDGLLLDTERIGLASFLETCEHFGVGNQTELFIRCIGTNQAFAERILEEGLKGKVNHLDFYHVWDSKYNVRISNKPIPLKCGASRLLDHLAMLQMPVAVATSTDSSKAVNMLKNSGILKRFNVVIGGDQVERSKPYPDIYLKSAEILGVKATKCLALEDSENGVRSAINAGMTVVQVPDMLQPSQELIKIGHIILGSLNELVNYEFQVG